MPLHDVMAMCAWRCRALPHHPVLLCRTIPDVPQLSEAYAALCFGALGPYWAAGRKLVDARYKGGSVGSVGRVGRLRPASSALAGGRSVCSGQRAAAAHAALPHAPPRPSPPTVPVPPWVLAAALALARARARALRRPVKLLLSPRGRKFLNSNLTPALRRGRH